MSATEDWKQSCSRRLPEFLDADGDLAPPWEQFPTYERFTIGWRMGDGEDWIGLWHVFLDTLGPATDARLAYLRRHPPAPVTWADAVHGALHPSVPAPSRGRDDETAAAERREAFRRTGLIASDIAYPTWLSQQRAIRWPWERAETPEDAARYHTREFWFWSRRVSTLRTEAPSWPPAVPNPWRSCIEPLKTGRVDSPDPRNGLLTLAQMLTAGPVIPPWLLGLTLSDFADSFEPDMGFVDAFRLWGMSAFDDHEHLQRYLAETQAPEDWSGWCAERLMLV